MLAVANSLWPGGTASAANRTLGAEGNCLLQRVTAEKKCGEFLTPHTKVKQIYEF